MEKLFIEKKEWEKFIKNKLEQYTIYAPFKAGENLHFSIVKSENVGEIVYNGARCVEPLKIFFFPFKERIVPQIENLSEIVIMGATNCDITALGILDKVFREGDYKDPNYLRRRENSIIISFDCQKVYESCFCEIVGVHPYGEKNFDLNLTYIEEGFVIEVGSEKGKNFIGRSAKFYQANQSQLEKREDIRKKMVEKVKEINKDFKIENIPDAIKGAYETELWKDIKDIENCVQCGSCTSNCPSCVCFLLEDTSSDEEFFKKMKIWDSCLFPGYARMASGATPRPTLYDRYANRLLCKYWYMVENFGMVGCTGCGRCIAGCIGKIDKRKVLSEFLKVKERK